MAPLVDHIRYNHLPSLEEAIPTLTARTPIQVSSIDDIINVPIRDVFLNHAAHLTICFYLQHRHHTVGTDETVVKVKGTAHLMDDKAIKDIVSFGNKLIPSTWMVVDHNVLPMEFAVVPAGTAAPAFTPALLSDFLSVLVSSGCDGLFGIDTLAKGAWSEMKIGDASVVVPSNHSDCYDQDNFIPVAFAFEKEKPTFTVHGKCGKDHKHTSRPIR